MWWRLVTSEGTVGTRVVRSLVTITVSTQGMVAVSAVAGEAASLPGASSGKETHAATEL